METRKADPLDVPAALQTASRYEMDNDRMEKDDSGWPAPR